MQIVHYVIFVGGDLLPLEIVHVHFLARAIINTSEDVDVVAEVVGRVKETGIRHRAQFYELHGLQVEHHSVFCSSTVVVATQNNHLV